MDEPADRFHANHTDKGTAPRAEWRVIAPLPSEPQAVSRGEKCSPNEGGMRNEA